MPASFGHYVENTGNTTLRFLEIFNTNRFEDISLSQVRRPRLHEPPDMSADQQYVPYAVARAHSASTLR